MSARLISTVFPDNVIFLNRFPFLIGRGADVVTTLEDRWVSRRHCEIREEGGSLVLRDLESRHGTLVNGQPIHETVLKSGDRVTIGLSTFVAEIESTAVVQ